MNKKKGTTASIVLVFVAAVSSFAQSSFVEAIEEFPAPIGTMVYLVGEVAVHRNGGFLDQEYVDFGLEIEDYDLVQTGNDGNAEVELSTPATRNMMVTVSENTAFYFDVSRLNGRNTTTVEMLSGSIGLKVQRLLGDSAVLLRTASVVMGVRGTEFTVSAAPDGSYLITCREGDVVCEDDSGIERRAFAGQVVEKTDDLFRSVAVPVTELDRYRTDWVIERERIFRTQAALFIRGFAQQYRNFEPQFIDSLVDLIGQREVFDLWAQAYRSGVEIPIGELLTQRAQVTPSVIAVRSTLPLFEQLFYRLKTLERYHEQGIGRTTIERGLTSTAFFDGFAENSRSIEQGLAAVRYYLKLYARMSGFEESSLLDEMLSDRPLGPPAPIDLREF